MVALAVAAVVVVALSPPGRVRALAFWRAVVAALLLFGLTYLALRHEDRRPLKDVVAVVVDHSGSNRIGERGQQTEAARAEVARQLAGLDNIEPHFVETPRNDPDNKGTELFAALREALSDTPPERSWRRDRHHRRRRA